MGGKERDRCGRGQCSSLITPFDSMVNMESMAVHLFYTGTRTWHLEIKRAGREFLINRRFQKENKKNCEEYPFYCITKVQDPYPIYKA